VARRTRRGTAAAAAATPDKFAASMVAEASATASAFPGSSGAGTPLLPAAAATPAAEAVHCPYLVGKRPPRAWNMGLLDADNDLLRAIMPW
jgi:hypothetical protein